MPSELPVLEKANSSQSLKILISKMEQLKLKFQGNRSRMPMQEHADLLDWPFTFNKQILFVTNAFTFARPTAVRMISFAGIIAHNIFHIPDIRGSNSGKKIQECMNRMSIS